MRGSPWPASPARPSTIRLGTLVTSATFRYPGPLAISVAQVDAMSGGRVELGLGAGWYEEEHLAYGIPFPSSRSASTGSRSAGRDHRPVGTPVGESFSYDGAHHRIVDSPALPKPFHRAGPPIMMGGMGKRRTPALAAPLRRRVQPPVRLRRRTPRPSSSGSARRAARSTATPPSWSTPTRWCCAAAAPRPRSPPARRAIGRGGRRAARERGSPARPRNSSTRSAGTASSGRPGSTCRPSTSTTSTTWNWSPPRCCRSCAEPRAPPLVAGASGPGRQAASGSRSERPGSTAGRGGGSACRSRSPRRPRPAASPITQLNAATVTAETAAPASVTGSGAPCARPVDPDLYRVPTGVPADTVRSPRCVLSRPVPRRRHRAERGRLEIRPCPPAGRVLEGGGGDLTQVVRLLPRQRALFSSVRTPSHTATGTSAIPSITSPTVSAASSRSERWTNEPGSRRSMIRASDSLPCTTCDIRPGPHLYAVPTGTPRPQSYAVRPRSSTCGHRHISCGTGTDRVCPAQFTAAAGCPSAPAPRPASAGRPGS